MKKILFLALSVFLFSKSFAQPFYVYYTDQNGINHISTTAMPASAITQPFIPVAIFSAITSATINTIAETTLIGTVIGSTSIPATSWYVGKSYSIEIFGTYSAPALNVGSLTAKTYLGSNLILSGTIANLLASASNLPFSSKILIVCRSIGSSVTIMVTGYIDYSIGLTVAPLRFYYTPTATTFTSGDLSLNITGTYSNGTVGNSITSINVICVPEN